MSLEEIIADYCNRHSEKSHSEIASTILLDYDTLSLSHRTLRRKIGELRTALNPVQVNHYLLKMLY